MVTPLPGSAAPATPLMMVRHQACRCPRSTAGARGTTVLHRTGVRGDRGLETGFERVPVVKNAVRPSLNSSFWQIPHRQHAGGSRSVYVELLEIADVGSISRSSVQILQGVMEDAGIGLEPAKLVGEDEDLKAIGQAVLLDDFPQDLAAGVARVADQAEAVGASKPFDSLGDAGHQRRQKLERQVLVGGGDPRERDCVWREAKLLGQQ